MLKDKKIGFIGAGVMAKAIIKGLLNSQAIPAENITASEISKELADKASEATGIKVIADNKEIIKNSDIIILSTKPNTVESILYEIKDTLTPNKLLVSIAARISTDFIEDTLGAKTRLMRVMPNTPAVLNEGMSAICKGRHATEQDEALIFALFNNIGRCIKVPERLISTVTGISGSGPAFIYLIIEALADGGVKLGLTKQAALELAAQTFLGAAKMVLETGKHPAVLKDEVTTPGGSKIVGLLVMEEAGVRHAMAKTVIETSHAALELGK